MLFVFFPLISNLMVFNLLLYMQGRFEIISLTGSFLRSESNGSSGPSGLSVSLAGADGRVLGGGVAGMLMAATPVQVRCYSVFLYTPPLLSDCSSL